MKTKITITALGGCLAFGCGIATAQTPTLVGTYNCNEWSGQQSNLAKTWLLGVLSGMNVGYLASGPKTATGGPAWDPLQNIQAGGEVFPWMDAYCKAHPKAGLVSGALDLYGELTSRKQNGR